MPDDINYEDEIDNSHSNSDIDDLDISDYDSINDNYI